MTNETVETRMQQILDRARCPQHLTREDIIRGLAMYDAGLPSGNEVWRAKCAYARQLKRELEFRNLLDRQDFFFALWLAFPEMQNPMAYMQMRINICTEN